jgi:RNA polymerase sigma factor (sigma-70 family)
MAAAYFNGGAREDRPERAAGAGPRHEAADPVALGGLSPGEAPKTLLDVRAFSKGDDSAFERIWIRYRPTLEVFVLGRVRAGLNPALRAHLDAEVQDLLQETALRVFEKLRDFEYRGPGSILAWMSRIATNVVQERGRHWRAEKRDVRRERPLPPAAARDGTPYPEVVLRASRPGPSTSADLAERRRRVAAALATLSERDHTIVFWRFFGGAEWEEIAREVRAPSADAVRKECNGRILPALASVLAAR